MKRIISILFFIIITFSKAYSQYGTGVLDLGFENGIKSWIVVDQSKKAVFTKNKKCVEGNYSLSIEPNGSSAIFLGIMADMYNQNGTVKIVCSLHGNNINVQDLNPHLQTMSGNVYMGTPEITDEVDGWRKCEVTIDLKESVNQCMISLIYKGKEKILIDDMKLQINGVDLLKYKANLYSKITEDKEFNKGSKIEDIILNKQTRERLYKLSKIWGLLKYYHPNIAAGEYNWDYELFRIMPVILKTNSDFNTEVFKWIDKLGKFPIIEEKRNIKDESLFDWIKECGLGDELTEKLFAVIENSNIKSNYYVSVNKRSDFKNENSYEELSYLDCGYRLLSLFRAWNIIEYFYPYKYLTDKRWDDVLYNYIDTYVNVKDSIEYGKAVFMFSREICDGHSFVSGGNSSLIDKSIGMKSGRVLPIIVGNSPKDRCIVLDTMKGNNNIFSRGDILTHINGVELERLKKENRKYFSSSNESSYNLRFNFLSILHDQTEVEVKFKRKNKKITSNVITNDGGYSVLSSKTKTSLLTNEIGYINVNDMSSNDCDSMMNLFKNTKAIIFDLRSYPKDPMLLFGVAPFLNNKPYSFSKIKFTSDNSPGIFINEEHIKIGSNNENCYKGKIIILVNNQTMSQGETYSLALRSLPNSMTIGSQTAGANGDMVSFTVPGGYDITFSCIGIYDQSMIETQRVGVGIDEIVKPTIKGIREGRDEVLERAIEIVNSKTAK